MEQNLEYYDRVLKDTNVTILKKTTGNVIKSKKCKQSYYASSQSGHLRSHLDRSQSLLYFVPQEKGTDMATMMRLEKYGRIKFSL